MKAMVKHRRSTTLSLEVFNLCFFFFFVIATTTTSLISVVQAQQQTSGAALRFLHAMPDENVPTVDLVITTSNASSSSSSSSSNQYQCSQVNFGDYCQLSDAFPTGTPFNVTISNHQTKEILFQKSSSSGVPSTISKGYTLVYSTTNGSDVLSGDVTTTSRVSLLPDLMAPPATTGSFRLTIANYLVSQISFLNDQDGLNHAYSLPFGVEAPPTQQWPIKFYYFFVLYGPNLTEVPLGGYSNFESGQNYLGVVIGNVSSENADFTARLAILALPSEGHSGSGSSSGSSSGSTEPKSHGKVWVIVILFVLVVASIVLGAYLTRKWKSQQQGTNNGYSSVPSQGSPLDDYSVWSRRLTDDDEEDV